MQVGSSRRHKEAHRSGRGSWLRAAVLGSNDAIVSTSSLMVGVAASAQSEHAVLTAGIAGVVAGAMSMAVGEYISVSSQRDAELADIAREKRELREVPQAELNELSILYERRGLTPELARTVAEQLTAHDALAAHLREELQIEAASGARPLQAAWVSAASFGAFGSIPLLALLVVPESARILGIALTSLLSLGILGGIGGRLGGAPMARAALRVTLGGGLAMAITAAIGRALEAAPG